MKIYDLPLKLGNMHFFKAIGTHPGGLNNVSSKILNLIDCTAALIQMEKNSCDFTPAYIFCVVEVVRTN